jgi:hypothetical protein
MAGLSESDVNALNTNSIYSPIRKTHTSDVSLRVTAFSGDKSIVCMWIRTSKGWYGGAQRGAM